jgi:hypothetical protein
MLLVRRVKTFWKFISESISKKRHLSDDARKGEVRNDDTKDSKHDKFEKIMPETTETEPNLLETNKIIVSTRAIISENIDNMIRKIMDKILYIINILNIRQNILIYYSRVKCNTIIFSKHNILIHYSKTLEL